MFSHPQSLYIYISYTNILSKQPMRVGQYNPGPEFEPDGFFPSGTVRPDSKFVRSGPVEIRPVHFSRQTGKNPISSGRTNFSSGPVPTLPRTFSNRRMFYFFSSYVDWSIVSELNVNCRFIFVVLSYCIFERLGNVFCW